MESDSSPQASSRRRYSPWALTAIVTALFALLLQGSLPPVTIAAAIFALMGLRQIRRMPERYIGRAFCWLAIALALILAILTAMVQPQPQVGGGANPVSGQLADAQT
ncbi:hypothetical protein HOP52_01270 [Halomonas campisalis]|uniref:DUF4190 domain-containing protein n=1 Tax=Billgrantia campisalis TaxID=74661 RepID=A0ABS9P3V8_9GAMM|nr:hypothetical protein [Halomonas campisalis]MCG6656409.1 hypothetical protein [Halomonas campisalis]MDR5861595.1 hypothetical protein [Halomonas campisalis]